MSGLLFIAIIDAIRKFCIEEIQWRFIQLKCFLAIVTIFALGRYLCVGVFAFVVHFLLLHVHFDPWRIVAAAPSNDRDEMTGRRTPTK